MLRGNTHQTIKEIDSTSTATVHYASYENNKKSKKKPHSTEQNANSTKSTKSCYRCGEPYSKEHEPVCKAQEAFCNGCGIKGHLFQVCRSSGKFPHKQKSNSTDRKQTHYISEVPAQVPSGFYNEQGNWVAEPPRPSSTIKSMYSLSVVEPTPVIQDIQGIHPEADTELPSTQGMSQSQISFRENSKTFDSSRDAVSNRTGSISQAISTEKQPYAAEFDQILQFFRLTGFQAISRRSGHSAFYRCFCPELPWHRNRSRNLLQCRYRFFKEFSSFLFQRCSRIFSKKGRNSPTTSNQFYRVPAILQETEYQGDFPMQRSSRERIIWQVET